MRRFRLMLLTTAMLFSLGCALPKFISSLFNDRKTNSEQQVDINNKKFDYRSVDNGLAGHIADENLLNDKTKESKRLKFEAEHIDQVIDRQEKVEIQISQ